MFFCSKQKKATRILSHGSLVYLIFFFLKQIVGFFSTIGSRKYSFFIFPGMIEGVFNLDDNHGSEKKQIFFKPVLRKLAFLFL
jgi:hypothetical protein